MNSIFRPVALCLIAGAFSGCSIPQQKIDTSQYFAYPATELIIVSGSSQAILQPAANYSYPQKSGERPGFRGGHEEQGFPAVHYEFVGRCEQGDVYVFSIEESGRITKMVPFVYSGKESTILEEKNVKIMLQPKEGYP